MIIVASVGSVVSLGEYDKAFYPFIANIYRNFGGMRFIMKSFLNLAKGSTGLMRFSLRHDDVIKWKHFPRYWPFVRGIHRWPVNSSHKGQWRRALIFLWSANGWVNNRDAGDLRRHHTHYEVIVMKTGACLAALYANLLWFWWHHNTDTFPALLGLCEREFTGSRWIPFTNCQWYGHYLTQWWHIVRWILKKIFKWNLNRKIQIFA